MLQLKREFAVCLQIDPESHEWGLSVRSVDLAETHSGNDNMRVKQTMLYFKRVAIFRNKLLPKYM